MRQDLEVSESIEINTGPDKVWKALINTDIIKKYLFGTQTINDWKVGSEIVFQGEYRGITCQDKGENYSLVTYNADVIGRNKTRFAWTQKGFAGQQGYEHSKNGME